MLSLARNALVVIIGTVIAYDLRDEAPFKITGKYRTILFPLYSSRVAGEVKGGFPPFEAPPFSINLNGTEYSFSDMAQDYGPSIAFIPLVAILEAISIGKAFCKYSLDPQTLLLRRF
jgi:sodium-independent sulfate anion transporter 11